MRKKYIKKISLNFAWMILCPALWIPKVIFYKRGRVSKNLTRINRD